MTDRLDFPFDHQAIEPLDRQRHENLDAVFEREIGVAKCCALLRLGARDGGRIRHPNVRLPGCRAKPGTFRSPPGRTP